jgi:hypothetical protein
MTTIRLIAVSAIAALAFAASAIPAFGDGSGTVSATVTAAAPCITVSNTSLDFGALPFSTPDAVSTKRLPEGASNVASCSAQSERLFVHGTDATGPSASWTLAGASAGPCIVGPNKYGLSLRFNFEVVPSDVQFATLPAGQSTSPEFGLTMPCTGSDGAGQTLSFQYVFTATF